MFFTAIALHPPPPYGYGVCFSMIHHHNKRRRAQPIIMLAARHSSIPPKIATAAVAAAMIFSIFAAPSAAAAAEAVPDSGETLSNIPQTLSSGEECSSSSGPGDCKKPRRIQRPKSKKAENCTVKCLNTCIRGGYGSPGEGPLNIRKPLVVFKDTFRSRQYCLMECSDICNLIGDFDDGP